MNALYSWERDSLEGPLDADCRGYGAECFKAREKLWTEGEYIEPKERV